MFKVWPAPFFFTKKTARPAPHPLPWPALFYKVICSPWCALFYRGEDLPISINCSHLITPRCTDRKYPPVRPEFAERKTSRERDFAPAFDRQSLAFGPR
jgi:hypothetical protein